MGQVIGGRYTPRNGASDPNIDQKLDDTFGTAEELAQQARTGGERPVEEEAEGPDSEVTASDVAAALAAGWPATPGAILGAVLPDLSVKRGGIAFPQREDQIPRHWPMIYTLLWRVMAEVNAVTKGELFKGGGVSYNFRGIDAVVNALGPAFRKHGVIPVPKVKKTKYRDTMTTGEQPKPTREVTVKVKYTFYAPDGSKVVAKVPGESLDHSDKGSAKAMSVAFRIVMLQMFALPTTEPDPDASYHTRDGVGSMGSSVARFLRTRIGLGQPGVEALAGAAELEQLWPIVLEHSAAERTIPEVAEPTTWAQGFLARFLVLIEEIETWEEGKAMLGVLERLGLQRALGLQLKARADFLRERTLKTFDHCMEQVVTAGDGEALEAARGCARAAQETGILTPEHVEQIDAVARERWAKLRETPAAPKPSAAEGPDSDVWATEGEHWNAFVRQTDEATTFEEIMARLTNDDGWSYPAATWGAAGLQRIADAAARAHRRDHTITNEQRADLEQAIREQAHATGIDFTGSWAGE